MQRPAAGRRRGHREYLPRAAAVRRRRIRVVPREVSDLSPLQAARRPRGRFCFGRLRARPAGARAAGGDSRPDATAKFSEGVVHMSEQTFYITTPIYYPNDKLHIGHTYTTVAADALARYHRLLGHKTWFLTGTDEHGLNVERAARQAGKEPLEYSTPSVAWINELRATQNSQYDDFIRTTEERHKRVVQHFFQRLYDQGDIYKGAYKGLYCANCEAYYTEDELKEGRIC